jgi:hypothetical protein
VCGGDIAVKNGPGLPIDAVQDVDKYARSPTYVRSTPSRHRSCGARGAEACGCRWRRWRPTLLGWWANCRSVTVAPKRG